ncbi:MAG: hypothetical protein KJ773_09805, partial [Candidatus Thermoplasmatota archaeon]|nr:hypothetical protein [Candidatus Thermoplasmatota archaeon]
MDKEEVLSYFADKNSPVGLLRHRWSQHDYATSKRTKNFTQVALEYDSKINLQPICFWTIGSLVLHQDRLYNKGVYPREAVIYGDVKEV